MPTQRKLQKSSCDTANNAFSAAAATAANIIIAAMTDTEQTLKFRTDMAAIVLDRSVGKAKVLSTPLNDEEIPIINIVRVDPTDVINGKPLLVCSDKIDL